MNIWPWSLSLELTAEVKYLSRKIGLKTARDGEKNMTHDAINIFFKLLLKNLLWILHFGTNYSHRIECFHSRGQHLCKFIGTKESVTIRKEFNSQSIGLVHQHGRRFNVLGHQYGRRDVSWKHSINNKRSLLRFQSTTAHTNRGWSACGSSKSRFFHIDCMTVYLNCKYFS